jgi:hypothetical protein
MAKPNKCITVDDAKELQNKWKESRALEIEQAQGYQDTREFWYSLDELQEYLDYVKEQSTAQGINKPGIRIYFGAYAKTPVKKSYATIFLAPTKEKSAPLEGEEDTSNNAVNNYDIDPMNITSGGDPPKEY